MYCVIFIGLILQMKNQYINMGVGLSTKVGNVDAFRLVIGVMIADCDLNFVYYSNLG